MVRYGKKVQAQDILSQSSFYSVNDSRLHFGLGSEKTADIAIRWPSGAHEELKGVAADQLIVVKEGTGVVVGGVGPSRSARSAGGGVRAATPTTDPTSRRKSPQCCVSRHACNVKILLHPNFRLTAFEKRM